MIALVTISRVNKRFRCILSLVDSSVLITQNVALVVPDASNIIRSNDRKAQPDSGIARKR